MSPPLVSVLIVNYNGASHLERCLTGLSRQTLARHRFEVVLVDNASTDNSVEIVRSKFPWVRFLGLRKNHGFAEGNNIAARHAHGDLLALLNNDTIPDSHWLEELTLLATEHPGAAVAGKLLFAHDPSVVNSGGLYLLRDGRGADRGFHARDDGRFEAVKPTFAGCGASLLIPRSKESLFDRRYFVYYEDLDAGWRHRLLTGQCWYAPRAVVRHVHGAAAGDKSPLFWFYVERNRALTALRNADPFLALWSAIGLFCKVGQSLMRCATGQGGPRGRKSVALAVAWAAADYLRLVPRNLVERYSHRCGRQQPRGS